MKKLIILFVIIALSNTAKSQTDEELLKPWLFNKVEITSPLVDNEIVFIETNNPKIKNIVIFLQGSGNRPIGVKKAIPDNSKKNPYDAYITLPPISYPDYWNNYRFVVISKPDVPLFQTYEESEKGNHNPKFRTKEFLKHNNLDYYVKSTTAVIDYYKKQDKENNIILVGHSQGYHVVARTAVFNEGKISKVVCMSANPLGRNIEFTRKNRLEEYVTKDTTGIYQAKIERLDSVFSYYKNDGDKLDIEQKNEYTFIEHASIDDILKLNIPVRIVYGTGDVMSWDNDIIPIFATRLNKSNISTKVYVGYGHNYEVKIDGKETKWYWDEVFADVIKWIEK